MTSTRQTISAGDVSFGSIGVKHTRINEADGVQLDQSQKVLVGSVLDLMEGRPSLKHLSLWSSSAIFKDPLAIAEGFDRYAAQWYGLASLFNPISIQSHRVTSAGDPIVLELSNKYVLKGIRKEYIINSVIKIDVGSDGLIHSLEDRWNDKLPDSGVSEVFRKLNAMVASNLVKVPQSEEEDRKLQASRDQDA